MAEVEVENEHRRDLPPQRGGVLQVEELAVAGHRDRMYQMIRDAGPVVRCALGAYLVTAAGPASYVLKHPELFSSKRAFDSLGALIGLDHLPLAFPNPTSTATRTTP